MQNTVVCIDSITIENFKNVVKGHLNFANRRGTRGANILGLYGQNGSGKTALIDAMELLQWALKGQSIPEKFADFINVGAENASLSYEFCVRGANEEYHAYYEVKIKSEKKISAQNMDIAEVTENSYEPVIYEEVLSYSYEGREKKIRKTPLIDTRSVKVFAPVAKYNCLVGRRGSATTYYLMGAKQRAFDESRSFVFSRELLTGIRTHEDAKNNKEYKRHVLLLESLVRFGNYELFVINTTNTGMISLNALPLTFKYDGGSNVAVGRILLPLEEDFPLPQEDVSVAENVINSMNLVLPQIVPGLTICVKNLGNIVFSDGQEGAKIQLMSRKNKKEIPLKYESEGIKKIVSVLQLLIIVYNRPSITVAIDELDSGIFEYLLGELLRIISEKGKGQLIFTSHNLRPLETLDRGFIAFTTTNPQNRYIRMSNLKDNNNLRDVYFRDIIVGEQSEELYDLTNNAEISLAFREAGEFCGA